MTTGLVLLAAAAFGSSAMAQSLSNAPIEMPRALFDKIIDPILRAPGIMTGLVPELNNKTTAPVQPATSENTVLVKDVVYREVNFWISDFSAPNRQYLPLGLAISFFLAARFFWGAVLMRLAAMMGWAIFGLLQIFKVAEIKTEPVDKETIKIKDAV